MCKYSFFQGNIVSFVRCSFSFLSATVCIGHTPQKLATDLIGHIPPLVILFHISLQQFLPHTHPKNLQQLQTHTHPPTRKNKKIKSLDSAKKSQKNSRSSDALRLPPYSAKNTKKSKKRKKAKNGKNTATPKILVLSDFLKMIQYLY